MRPYSTLEHRLELRGPIGERKTLTGVPPDPRERVIGSQLSQDDAAMHIGGKRFNTLVLLYHTYYSKYFNKSFYKVIMNVLSSHCHFVLCISFIIRVIG